MINEDSLQKRNAAILPHLDERQRRLFAAAEAKAAGYGGIAAVSRVTRIAASTIGRGLKDIAAPVPLAPGRVRRPGGGLTIHQFLQTDQSLGKPQRFCRQV